MLFGGSSVSFSGAAMAMALTSQAAGDLLVASSGSAWGRTAVGAAGTVLIGGSAPAWSASPSLTDLTLSGTLHTKQGADTAAAQPLVVPSGQVAVITGAVTINGIVTTGYQDGDLVYLVLTHSATASTLTHGSGTPGTNAAKLLLRGGVDYTGSGFATGNDKVALMLLTVGGVRAWHEVGRSSSSTAFTMPGFSMVQNSAGGFLSMGSSAYTPTSLTAGNAGGLYKLITAGTTTGFALCDSNFASMLSTSGLIGGTPRVLVDALLKWPAANVQATVGAAGGGSALPATPTGYTKIDVNGTVFVQPYYAAS